MLTLNRDIAKVCSWRRRFWKDFNLMDLQGCWKCCTWKPGSQERAFELVSIWSGVSKYTNDNKIIAVNWMKITYSDQRLSCLHQVEFRSVTSSDTEDVLHPLVLKLKLCLKVRNHNRTIITQCFHCLSAAGWEEQPEFRTVPVSVGLCGPCGQRRPRLHRPVCRGHLWSRGAEPELPKPGWRLQQHHGQSPGGSTRRGSAVSLLERRQWTFSRRVNRSDLICRLTAPPGLCRGAPRPRAKGPVGLQLWWGSAGVGPPPGSISGHPTGGRLSQPAGPHGEDHHVEPGSDLWKDRWDYSALHRQQSGYQVRVSTFAVQLCGLLYSHRYDKLKLCNDTRICYWLLMSVQQQSVHVW